jgi:hypothetical protein
MATAALGNTAFCSVSCSMMAAWSIWKKASSREACTTERLIE